MKVIRVERKRCDLYNSCSHLAEIEMDFTVPLKDVSVPEKKQAKFECTITKDVPKVMWLRGPDIVSSDEKYDIIDDGKRHMLVINHCEFDDEGEYTIEVLGKKSAAKLTVEGKLFATCNHTSRISFGFLIKCF